MTRKAISFLLVSCHPRFLSQVPEKSKDDWDLFHSWLEFELADFLYSHSQMPAAEIDSLLDIWVASLLHSGGDLLFNNHKEIYGAIDDIKIGDIKWKNFMVQYTGVRPPSNVPPWMEDTYQATIMTHMKLCAALLQIQTLLLNWTTVCIMSM